MESSYAHDSAKELSMLNLSMGPEELAERKEEHKSNLVATMMDRKAIHGQNKFTALAAGRDRTGQVNAMPMRNLKLTCPDSQNRRA